MPFDDSLADRDPNTIDFICGITDRQRLIFGKKLASDEMFILEHIHDFKGDCFEKWVITQLGDDGQICRWSKHLKRVGCG